MSARFEIIPSVAEARSWVRNFEKDGNELTTPDEIKQYQTNLSVLSKWHLNNAKGEAFLASMSFLSASIPMPRLFKGFAIGVGLIAGAHSIGSFLFADWREKDSKKIKEPGKIQYSRGNLIFDDKAKD